VPVHVIQKQLRILNFFYDVPTATPLVGKLSVLVISEWVIARLSLARCN
jgi:hypothetical protein